MMNAATPPPLLNNRYQVIRVLGEGGFGKTYLAEDTQMPSRRKVVVKQLKPVNDSNPQIHQLVQDRFQREAALLEELGRGYEQIPELYAHFTEAEQFYLVEEWIEGDTLTQKVQREGPLLEKDVRAILLDLLPVLSYIHQRKIIHRDIKPDNIILRGQDRKPVLIDFGAVKETMRTKINSQGQSSLSIVVGTAGYMPVEQMAGRPVYASDIYSLGMTAIYLLTGKTPPDLPTDPQTGEVLWRGSATVNPHLAAVLERSIHLQARDRFATAEEMLTALTITNDSGSSAPPAPPFVAKPLAETVFSAAQLAPDAAANPLTSKTGSTTKNGQATQIMAPGAVAVQTSSANEWLKAVILGGIIGGAILAGALLIRQELPRNLSQTSSTSPSASSPPVGSPKSSESPQSTTSAPGSVNSAQQVNSPPVVKATSPVVPITPPSQQPVASAPSPNATVVGEPGEKNIRTGPGPQYGVRSAITPGTRIVVTGYDQEANGFRWYKIYVPGSGVEGWIAHHLVEVDGQTSEQAGTDSGPVDTDATIVGEPGSKNIRTGPGTQYGVQNVAYLGDRVRIIGSGRDRGGYLWYKVYFPRSGANGWIAAQLIKRD